MLKKQSSIEIPNDVYCKIIEHGNELLQFPNTPDLYFVINICGENITYSKLAYCQLCQKVLAISNQSTSNGVKHYASIHLKKNSRNSMNCTLKCICKHILFSNRPLSDLRSKYYKDILPERHQSMKTIIKNIHVGLLQKIKEILNDVPFLSLTADEWSNDNQKYLGVQAYYYENSKINTIALSHKPLDRTDATWIAQTIQEIIDFYSISNKIIAITTDTDSTICAAVRILGIPWIPCAAHLLNLILKKFIHSIPNVNSIMNTAGCYRRSLAFTQFAIDNDKENKYPHVIRSYTEIRWYSFFQTILDIAEAAPIIEKFQESDKYDLAHKFEEIDLVNCKSLINLSKKVILIYEIFQQTTNPVLCYVEHCFKMLENEMDLISDQFEIAYLEYVEQKNAYFNKHNYYITKQYKIGILLNPNLSKDDFLYYHDYFSEVEKEINNAISANNQIVTCFNKRVQSNQRNPRGRPRTKLFIENLTNTVVSQDKEKLNDEHSDEVSISSSQPTQIISNPFDEITSVETYFNSLYLDHFTEKSEYQKWDETKQPTKASIYQYWDSLQNIYPLLSKYALKFLIGQGTTVVTERGFYQASRIVESSNRQYKPSKLEALVMIRLNSEISEKIFDEIYITESTE
ncbi:hypothetical protein TRFO_13544 [Tritrichomonas foetus]|uniref:HAT C-terminal dimerisation domain-containing protein n=1 Tax=Tritrichomonas foetus TaxID=1144522 RepID=A0A1J4KXT3_9EUKA|nr:hypothetical protein TRFO_13544 [Tritrichomonas foetus]|eukprot:OHT16047.1 hypothetical protein TRFO_13544 [Tritrichomonas foetus]